MEHEILKKTASQLTFVFFKFQHFKVPIPWAMHVFPLLGSWVFFSSQDGGSEFFSLYFCFIFLFCVVTSEMDVLAAG